MNESQQLILASSSPRRRELLDTLTTAYQIVPPLCDELTDAESPRALVCANARIKSDWVRQRHPDAHVIAADTVVVVDTCILGKPKSREEAVETLLRLSGSAHHVHSGFSLYSPHSGVTERHVVSDVNFRTLTREDVLEYFTHSNPMDKAGGYDIGARGDLVIDSYTGSKTNIMGLDTDTVQNWLLTEALC